MNHISFSILASSALLASAAAAAEVRFMRASSISGATPTFETLAEGVAFQARPEAEFVRLSWVFEKPVKLTRVELESCGAVFSDGVEIAVGAGGQIASGRRFIEGGKAVIAAELSGAEAEKVRTIAVNFGHSQPICLREARFFDGKKRIPLRVAKALPAAVSGTRSPAQPKTAVTRGPESDQAADLASDQTSGAPVEKPIEGAPSWRTDSPLNLFDSRGETSWLAMTGGDALIMEFETPVRFNRLRVWSGDQRSMRDFKFFARPEKLQLKGDPGYSESVKLTDSPIVQDIQLKKAFKGTKLSILVESAFEGLGDARAALSELRLVGAEGAFYPMRAGASRQKEVEAKNIDIFAKNLLARLLDREISTRDEEDNWTLRLRADGSFFVKGAVEETGKARSFHGFGTYDAEATDKRRVRLVLRGVKFAGGVAADSEPCPLACGGALAEKEEEIDEVIEIEKGKGGSFMVRNRTRRSDRTLPFADLQVRLSSLQE